MSGGPRIGRRAALGVGASTVAASTAFGCAQTVSVSPAAVALSRTTPLSDEAIQVVRTPEDGLAWALHDPGLVRLSTGNLLVAAPCLQRTAPGVGDSISSRTFLLLSADRGRSWEALPELPMSDATPFLHDGRLYMFVQRTKWGGVNLTASDDEGRSWRDPVTLFEGAYANVDTPVLLDGGRLHWALSVRDYGGAVVVIAADANADLLDPRAWRMSNAAAHPKTPKELLRGLDPQSVDGWLEPNVVSVNGRVRVLLRTQLDGQATTGLGAILDLDDGFGLSFTQFHPLPGGQCKFYVLYDALSRLYWMVSNLAADGQGQAFDWNAARAGGRYLGSPGNNRRFLMLWYGVDALNWFPAGCVARTNKLRQSFTSPTLEIDGDDLVLVAPTSVDGPNQIDADRVTFHRVTQFRALAMNLFPEDG